MIHCWCTAGVPAMSLWRQVSHLAPSAAERCQTVWTNCHLCRYQTSRWIS